MTRPTTSRRAWGSGLKFCSTLHLRDRRLGRRLDLGGASGKAHHHGSVTHPSACVLATKPVLPSRWAGCGIVVAMVASADDRALPSFADELIGALTVLAQPQISEVVRLGLGRTRASDQPPRVVSGLQVPTGGTVATLVLAGQRREDLAVLARTLSNGTVRRKRDSLRVLVNKALDGDVRSFKAEWLDALAVACKLSPEAVRTLQAAYSRPGDLDPDRVEHVVRRLLVEYPRPSASRDGSGITLMANRLVTGIPSGSVCIGQSAAGRFPPTSRGSTTICCARPWTQGWRLIG